MDQITWIAIAAVIVGACVRAAKQDALGAVLTQMFRPDGPPIAIPARALPFLALGFGVLAAVLDAKELGSSWQDAAKAGVLAAAGAVFGHELLSGVPGVKRLLGVAFVLGALTSVSACTPNARWAAAELLARKVQCALAHRAMSNEQILVECAIDPKDAANVLDIVGQEREHDAALMRQVGAQRCGDGGVE